MKLEKIDFSMLPVAVVPVSIPAAAWLTVFINNSGSFTLSTADALLLAGGVSAAVSLVIWGLLLAVSFFPWCKWVTAGIFGISSSMILQYHLGAEFFRTADYSAENTAADIILFLCCHILLLALPAAAALYQRERCFRRRVRISLILILMQLSTLIYNVLTAPQFSDNYDFKEYSFSEKEKFSFGAKENIIVLVVDCMGERIIKDVFLRYPEAQKIFRDFTCFDRMVSPLPRTMYAVPAMLTGVDFPGADKGIPEIADHGDYLNRSCRKKDSLLQLARAGGFRVEGYPFILQTISYAPEVIDNSEEISAEVRQDSVLKIIEVVQDRLTPAFLKFLLFGGDTSEMLPFVQQGMADGSDGLSYDQNFYRRLQKEFRIGNREKVFKYLHIHGAHDPVTTDEQLISRENALRHQQLRGSLKIIETLLQQLREAGLYDQSTIVITGDHTEKYTPEIVTFIKRPFEKKEALLFNSVPCKVSMISGSVAGIAGLDPRAASLFDLDCIPGSIENVRDKKQQFPRFTAWEKVTDKEVIPSPVGTVQGNHLLWGNRIMIELAGENTLQFADRVTATAGNPLTGERYRTSMIRGEDFHDLLLPETALPDGDYLITIEEAKADESGIYHTVSRVLPVWFRVKGTQLSPLTRGPDLFHLPVALDTEMAFHPFACFPGVKFSHGCRILWQSVLIAKTGRMQLRLPETPGRWRAEVQYAYPAMNKGDIVVMVNGRERIRRPLTDGEKNLYSFEIEANRDGLAVISFEFRSQEKSRSSNLNNYGRGRVFAVTVRQIPEGP